MTDAERLELRKELEMLTRLIKGLFSTVARLKEFVDKNV